MGSKLPCRQKKWSCIGIAAGASLRQIWRSYSLCPPLTPHEATKYSIKYFHLDLKIIQHIISPQYRCGSNLNTNHTLVLDWTARASMQFTSSESSSEVFLFSFSNMFLKFKYAAYLPRWRAVFVIDECGWTQTIWANSYIKQIQTLIASKLWTLN